MTKYSLDAIQQAIGVPPAVIGRPTQTSLWALKTHLIDGLRKIKHPDHGTEGWAPYMRTVDEQALVSGRAWRTPKNPGDYFTPTPSALTDRMIAVEENKFKAEKDLHDGFETIETVLTGLFESCIDSAFHTGATGMGQKGFGSLTAREILFRLFHLYGKPTLTEIEKAIGRMNAPMDRLQPVEVMIRAVEEVQMFFLANPEEDLQMKETQLISHALIKMKATGLYGKVINRWYGKDIKDRLRWADFRTFAVEQYELMLRMTEGTTIGEQGYGTAYNATHEDGSVGDDSAGSVMKTITTWAERASASEAEVTALRGELQSLQPNFAAMMSGQQQAANVAQQQPPTTIHVAKKRKSPRDGSYLAQQQQQQPPNVNQAMGWQQPRTMGQSYGQAQWNFAPQPQRTTVYNQAGQQNQGLRDQNNNAPPFSNRLKQHDNLLYCYSCGYDVDHTGYQCPRQKPGHLPHVQRNQAHTVPGASQKAQHKTLPDGTGAGLGWTMAQNVNKSFYTMGMQGQQPWANVYGQQQQHGGGRGRGYGGRGRGGGRGGGARGGGGNWNNQQWM